MLLVLGRLGSASVQGVAVAGLSTAVALVALVGIAAGTLLFVLSERIAKRRGTLARY